MAHVIYFVKFELKAVLLELGVKEGGHPRGDGGVLCVVPLEDGAGDPVASEHEEAELLARAHQTRGQVVSVEDNQALLASDI